MAASPSDESGPITGINVTPLVDVVLVLLIIFMATAPLLQKRAVNVNVPQAASAEKKATAAVEVHYAADRQLFLAHEPLALADLEGKLKGLLRLDPALHVSVAADESIPYGEVISLLDAVRGAGVKKVALDVRQKKG